MTTRAREQLDGLPELGARLRIGVIGGAEATEAQLVTAEAVGRCIAAAGAVLVCGGRGGVMEAACRGARAGGGLTVGILPGSSDHEANPWIDLALPTALGDARNMVIASMCHALVAVGGRAGTLTEIAAGLLYRRPVVSLGSWELTAPDGGRALLVAQSPEEAVAIAVSSVCV